LAWLAQVVLHLQLFSHDVDRRLKAHNSVHYLYNEIIRPHFAGSYTLKPRSLPEKKLYELFFFPVAQIFKRKDFLSCMFVCWE
jgi:hypothetical protein